jgi:hypothetical protein
VKGPGGADMKAADPLVAGLGVALVAAAFGSVLSSRGGSPRAGFALIVLAFSMLALLGIWRRGWP